MPFTALNETEPESCGAVRVISRDMGNGVVRIDLCHPSTFADARAFTRRDDVVPLDGVDYDYVADLVIVAFDVAGLPAPCRFGGASRSIDDLERECFIWRM